MTQLYKILLVLFASLALAACGGSSSSNKKPTPPPTCEQTNTCDPEPSCEDDNSCEPEPGCEDDNSCEPEPSCEDDNSCEPATTFTINVQLTGDEHYQLAATQSGFNAGFILPFTKNSNELAYVVEFDEQAEEIYLVLYRIVDDELERVSPEVKVLAFSEEQKALGFAISPNAEKALLPVIVEDENSHQLIEYNLDENGHLQQPVAKFNTDATNIKEVAVTYTADSSRVYLAYQYDGGNAFVFFYDTDETYPDEYEIYDLPAHELPPNTIINSLGFSNDGTVAYATQHGDQPGLYQFQIDDVDFFTSPTPIVLSPLTTDGGYLDQISVLNNQLYLPLTKNSFCDRETPTGDNSNATLVIYRMTFDEDMNINPNNAEKILEEKLGDTICGAELSDTVNDATLFFISTDDGTSKSYRLGPASAYIAGDTIIGENQNTTLTVTTDEGWKANLTSESCAGGHWDEANSQYNVIAASADCFISFHVSRDE